MRSARVPPLLLASALTGLLGSGVAVSARAHAGPVRALAATATPCPPGLLPGPSATPRADAVVPCLDAPAPLPAQVVAPEDTIGGPALARAGLVTDLPAGVPAPPDVPHLSYLLADLGTGDVLAAKAAHAWLAPASTVKILTALVALPRLDPDVVVVATPDDVAADGTRVGMVAGNPYRVADLFNGMLMVSGNDTANALARAYGGRDRIVADMNATAGHLGAWDTTVVDPSGLDAEGQRSSAYDLALLARAAAALPEFGRHARLSEAQFPGGTDGAGRPLPAFQIPNHDPLLHYPGAIGGKSGYTTKAANTYAGAATRGERTLLVAAMGSVVRQAESLEALLNWGFANAGQARAVGTLVAAGTPQPPRRTLLGPPQDDAVPSGSTTPSLDTAPDPAAAPERIPPGSTGWLERAWPAGLLAAVVLGAAGLAWRRRRPRRSRRVTPAAVPVSPWLDRQRQSRRA